MPGTPMPIINLVVYYILVSVFAINTASSSRWKILVIGLLTILSMVGIARGIPTWTGFIVSVVLGAAVSVLGLLAWLKLTRRQALLVTGSFVAFQVAMSVVVYFAFGNAN
jgi:hypothetical protein